MGVQAVNGGAGEQQHKGCRGGQYAGKTAALWGGGFVCHRKYFSFLLLFLRVALLHHIVQMVGSDVFKGLADAFFCHDASTSHFARSFLRARW